jgi:hypothetical protein
VSGKEESHPLILWDGSWLCADKKIPTWEMCANLKYSGESNAGAVVAFWYFWWRFGIRKAFWHTEGVLVHGGRFGTPFRISDQPSAQAKHSPQKTRYIIAVARPEGILVHNGANQAGSYAQRLTLFPSAMRLQIRQIGGRLPSYFRVHRVPDGTKDLKKSGCGGSTPR